MIVRADQLQLCALLSRKGNSGEVWRGTLWGKQVAVKLIRIEDVEERLLDCLRREVAVLLHTTGECKQARGGGGSKGQGVGWAARGRVLVPSKRQASRVKRPPQFGTHAQTGLHLQRLLCERQLLLHHHEALWQLPLAAHRARAGWACGFAPRLSARRQLQRQRQSSAGQVSVAQCSRPSPRLGLHPPATPAGKRLPLALAVKWGADVAKGLVELHRLGVICADLKPDNVLIDDDLGDAVIADFGISSVVAGTLSSNGGARGAAARSSGNIRGTPNYMAPEQFGPRHQHTIKVDIWGFACTFIHMVAGSPPWAGDSVLQICTEVGVRRSSPPVPRDLPQELAQLLQSCTEADPSRRPSASQLLKVWGVGFRRDCTNGKLRQTAAPQQHPCRLAARADGRIQCRRAKLGANRLSQRHRRCCSSWGRASSRWRRG
jgi:hypothetical protein